MWAGIDREQAQSPFSKGRLALSGSKQIRQVIAEALCLADAWDWALKLEIEGIRLWVGREPGAGDRDGSKETGGGRRGVLVWIFRTPITCLPKRMIEPSRSSQFSEENLESTSCHRPSKRRVPGRSSIWERGRTGDGGESQKAEQNCLTFSDGESTRKKTSAFARRQATSLFSERQKCCEVTSLGSALKLKRP